MTEDRQEPFSALQQALAGKYRLYGELGRGGQGTRFDQPGTRSHTLVDDDAGASSWLDARGAARRIRPAMKPARQPIRLSAHPLLLSLSILLACSSQPPTPARTFTLEDMRSLGWIEGLWLDAGEGRTSYWERYRFENDSVIRVLYYADAALTRAQDGGSISLQGGAIYYETPRGRWWATALDSDSIRFESVGSGRGRMTWRRESATHWVNEVMSSNGPLIFRLERVQERGSARTK